METVEVIRLTTFLLFVYLVLALIVERTIEILVAIFSFLELRLGWYRMWNRLAEKYRQRLECFYRYRGENSPFAENLIYRIFWKAISTKPFPGGREAVSAKLIRVYYVQIFCRLLALALSLGFVLWQRLDFVALVELMIPDAQKLIIITQFVWVRYLISAVMIAIGTEPLHQVITKLESLEKKRKKTMPEVSK